MDNQYQHWLGKRVTSKLTPFIYTYLVVGISSTGLAYLKDNSFGDVHSSQIDEYEEVEKLWRDLHTTPE